MRAQVKETKVSDSPLPRRLGISIGTPTEGNVKIITLSFPVLPCVPLTAPKGPHRQGAQEIDVSLLMPRAQPSSKFLVQHSEYPATSRDLLPVGSLARRPLSPPLPYPQQGTWAAFTCRRKTKLCSEGEVAAPAGAPSGHWGSLFPRGAVPGGPTFSVLSLGRPLSGRWRPSTGFWSWVTSDPRHTRSEPSPAVGPLRSLA